jgi:hypothetical protein
VSDVRERWRSGWLEATVYDSVVERERLAGVLGWLVWGIDTSAFYREIARLAEEPDGTVILDVPCEGSRSGACGRDSACATWLPIFQR